MTHAQCGLANLLLVVLIRTHTHTHNTCTPQVLIHVEKIGLKDFEIYEVPKISVNVVSGGKTMETWQVTSLSFLSLSRSLSLALSLSHSLSKSVRE